MFETATFLELMEKLCKKCYENSKSHGFWDEGEKDIAADQYDAPNIIKSKPWNFAEKIALIHSELSEAMEAHRKGNPLSSHDVTMLDPLAKAKDNPGCPDGVRRLNGIEEELADAVIRIADLCGKMGIDLGRCVLAKMSYNASRPHKHGKAY